MLVAAVVAGGALRGEWSADYTTPGSESKAAQDLLAERFPERSSNTFDVVWAAQDAAAPAARERVDAFLAEAATLEGVGTPPAAAAEVSRDGAIAVARVPLTRGPAEVPIATGERLIELAAAETAPACGSSSAAR